MTRPQGGKRDALRRQVEILSEGGWKPAEIRRIMAKNGQRVSDHAIRCWTDPVFLERARKSNRESMRRRRLRERPATRSWFEHAEMVAGP